MRRRLVSIRVRPFVDISELLVDRFDVGIQTDFDTPRNRRHRKDHPFGDRLTKRACATLFVAISDPVVAVMFDEEILNEGQIIETTLAALFEALQSSGASEQEAEVVFETMLDEDRIRVVLETARAA